MLTIFAKYNKDMNKFFKREKDRLPAYATTVSMPEFDSIPVKNWVAGNDSIQEMVNCLHPTFDSEDKRKDVIEFMQSLLKNALEVKVFVYGSVPLKTYLPQGDIDLTVLGTSDNNDLLQMVLRVLLAEEQKKKAAFQIQDIRSIDAEVQVVKCNVDGITVDITFNQLGGLRSLCFLEQIDRLVDKNHLFKRSIMVIKAWCYYESHTLGASHGLISTYGLEILILFIFHMYNASLTNPLMVLYRFLEYYSKFDWSNFCIGMDGPISKELLPLIIVKNPIKSCLLGGEDLRNVINIFMVPDKESDLNNIQNFRPKFLNVVDPLKDHNNIGRSVYANSDFMRIKCALRYGARRLGKIMGQPNENIREGIKTFFKNTFKLNSSSYIHELNSLVGSFSSSLVGEVNYEVVLSNAYTDEYNVSGRNGVSNVESMEGSDVSGFDTLSLEPDKQDVVSDGLSDFGNREEICGLEESENFNPFPDLTGYYDEHIRSLLYAHKFLGFSITDALVRAGLPYASNNGGGGPSEPVGCQPGSSWLQLNPNAPPFLLGESSMAHGTGSYIPVMNFVSRGRGRGPKTLTRPVQRGRWGFREIGSGSCAGANNNIPRGGSGAPIRVGFQKIGPGANINIPIPPDGSGAPNQMISSQEIGSGAPSRGNSQRKLIFGSFGPNLEIDHDNVPDSVTYFVPERKAGRVRDQPFELKNEAEFPALSV